MEHHERCGAVVIIGFPDDFAVVIGSNYLEDLTQMANQAVATIGRCLSTRCLRLADIRDISSQPPLRYLAVLIDTRLRFDEQLRTVSKKAEKLTNVFARIMSNIGGPSSSHRKLLCNVVNY